FDPAVLEWIPHHGLILRLPVFFLNKTNQKEEGELSVFSDGFTLRSPSLTNSWQFWKIASMDDRNCSPGLPCGNIRFDPELTSDAPLTDIWSYVNYATWFSSIR